MQEVQEKNIPLIEYLESIGFKAHTNHGKVFYKNFHSVENEVKCLYTGVGLRYISGHAVIELRGADTIDFLHRITTNSLKDLNKEEIRTALFTTEKGRIIDRTTLLNFGDYQLLVVSPENKKKVVSWIDKYTINDDVKIIDDAEKYTLLELIGPQAESFLSMICGNVINEIEPNKFKVISAEDMLFFTARIVDEFGNKKFWLIADIHNGQRLVQFMIENKGVFDFSLVGEDAYQIYRVEKGIPSAPFEINDNYNPHEVGLVKLINQKKGCYIGQEVIARLETYNKVQRILKGIIFNSNPVEGEEYQLRDEKDLDAGNITSMVYSYKLKKHIGLALIRRTYAETGTVLTARSTNTSLQVIVENIPLINT